MAMSHSNSQHEWKRFLVLCCALHLLVSFSGISKPQSAQTLWEFNKLIFLRIFLSALYSGVLFFGLSLALIAINQLLRAEIPPNVFWYLWIVIAAVFNTWFFLAGVPKLDTGSRGITLSPFPRGLKIFTVNVLLPLVGIYLVILYLYLFRLIRMGEWTGAWTSVLILALAFFGILSFLLLHPLLIDGEHKWLKKLSQGFYILTLPLAAFMIMAASKHVSDYGFTEFRYLRLALGLWLIYACLSSIRYTKRKLVRIPFSLFLIALFSCFGPWSMRNVSLKSQHTQLKHVFERNQMLLAGKISPTHTFSPLPYEEMHRLRSSLSYMSENGDTEDLQDLFEEDLSRFKTGDNDTYGFVLGIENYLASLSPNSHLSQTHEKTEAAAPVQAEEAIDIKTFYLNSKAFLPIKGYDFQADFTLNDFSEEWTPLDLNNDTLFVRFNKVRSEFELRHKTLPMIVLPATTLFKRLCPLATTQANSQHLSVEGKNVAWSVRLILTSVQLSKIVDISADHIAGKVQIRIY
jgi:hypothetical protein